MNLLPGALFACQHKSLGIDFWFHGNIALSKEEPMPEIDSIGNCETEQ